MSCPAQPLAFLFDVDGVVAETPHEKAWLATALEWGLIKSASSFNVFYSEHVAGEPGMTGARNILELLREPGSSTYYERMSITEDAAKHELAKKFRAAKQAYLERLIQNGDFKAYADIAELILFLKNIRTPIAAVSSSENAEKILRRISLDRIIQETKVTYEGIASGTSLLDLFDSTALGVISHWHGAPVDKTHHYAMAYGKLLGRIQSGYIPHVVAFEDAPRSILAVKKLGFYCIAVCRQSPAASLHTSREELRKSGADMVLTDEDLKTLNHSELVQDLVRMLNAD